MLVLDDGSRPLILVQVAVAATLFVRILCGHTTIAEWHSFHSNFVYDFFHSKALLDKFCESLNRTIDKSDSRISDSVQPLRGIGFPSVYRNRFCLIMSYDLHDPILPQILSPIKKRLVWNGEIIHLSSPRLPPEVFPIVAEHLPVKDKTLDQCSISISMAISGPQSMQNVRNLPSECSLPHPSSTPWISPSSLSG
ncbi:hypothetical protein FRB94_006869 [Tulasnella sp. JGI-2019a]|nr:hypothetical protein FRB94_006869 [Tulasnella sp. JGI-2019a]